MNDARTVERSLFCSLKVHAHFEKFAATLRAAKLLSILLAALRAARHGLDTSNLLPTPMNNAIAIRQ